MFLAESIEIGNSGLMKQGAITYSAPVVVAIRNPENFPNTWNALGTVYKIIPVNIDGEIFSCIAKQQQAYINLPNYCDFGNDNFRVGVWPVRWLYYQAETRYFLDVYA